MDAEELKKLEAYLTQVKTMLTDIEKQRDEIKKMMHIDWKEIEIEGKKAKVGMTNDGKVIVHFEFKDDAENYLKELTEK